MSGPWRRPAGKLGWGGAPDDKDGLPDLHLALYNEARAQRAADRPPRPVLHVGAGGVAAGGRAAGRLLPR